LSAIAQYLPFRKNVFDEVIALYSLYYVKTGLNKAFQEMIRVTKPNGKIRIHPMHNIGFTHELEQEPSLSIIEKAEANTLIISKKS